MLEFLSLHIYVRAFILLILLLLTTFNTCILCNYLFKRKVVLEKILLFAFSVFSFFTLIIFVSQNYADVFVNVEYSRTIFTDYFIAYFPAWIVNIIFLVWILFKDYKARKNSISPLSVKESFDNLPTGLCFSKSNGMIQLVNYQMNELSHIITGDDLQNANVFWDTVCNGKLINNITRLVSGENPELRFADGSVWHFSREDLGVTIQIVATEMTDYYLLTNTLKQKNEELEMMSDRLRKYGENVDEYTRTKERLETKVRIHNEIGQALLTTRRTLNSDDGDLKAVLEIWNRNISVLRMQSEPNNNADYVGELIKAAKSANVEVRIDGQLPEDKDIQQLIVASATEALTNAIRHADARKLIVEIDSTRKYYISCISNDGKTPDGPITEGGGLGSLRRRMEKIGGTMSVSWEPQFVLTIKIPKKSGELL